MHVLVISQQWAPESGILQRRMNWLVGGLRSAGHEVSVVTSPPHYPTGTLLSTRPAHQAGARAKGDQGETIYRTQFRSYVNTMPSRIADQSVAFVSSLGVVRRAFREQNPDLVLATAPPLPSILTAWYVHQRYGIPYVIDLRDAWPDLSAYVAYTDPRIPEPTRFRRVGARVIQHFGIGIEKAVRASDGIILTTYSHAEELSGRWGLRTCVLRNLAEIPLGKPTEEPELAEDKGLEVLYAGNIGRAQGLHSILDTVEILQQRNVPIHVRLQGEGPFSYYISKQARLRGLAIDVHARIPRSELQEIKANADTLLVPLQRWDPLRMSVPSKLFEAIVSGKHVTATAAGEAARIVRDSGAGDVVEPMDSVALADLWESLYRNPERLRVADAGIRWFAENCDADAELAGAVAFLESTLE